MIRELPFFESPIKGRLDITYALHSILNHPNGETFLYNYFVNTECWVHAKDNDINYNFLAQLARFDKSYLHYLNEFYEIEDFAVNGDVIEEITAKIDAGYYVYINFDDYYLQVKLNYMERHYEHISLVYGYDTKDKKLFVLGYNRMGSYDSMKIDYAEARKGYGVCSLKLVDIFKPDVNKAFIFDRLELVRQLEDYINGENRMVSLQDLSYFEIDKSLFAYGVSTNEYICIHLDNVKKRKCKYDNRNLHLLWEHKKIMVKRIEYLITDQKINNLILTPFLEIDCQVQVAKNLMLKWELTKDNSIVDKVQYLLKKLFKREIDLIEQLILKLREDWVLKDENMYVRERK